MHRPHAHGSMGVKRIEVTGKMGKEDDAKCEGLERARAPSPRHSSRLVNTVRRTNRP